MSLSRAQESSSRVYREERVATSASSQPRRILYVLGGGRVGGMETHLLRLLAALDRNRFSAVVCCVNGGTNYRLQLASAADRVENLQIDRFNGPLKLCTYVRALSRVFARWKPHIVQTYGYGSDVLVPFLARLLCPGAMVVTTRRGVDENPRHQMLRKMTNRYVDSVVCVSASVASFTEATEKIDTDKLRIIPNGVQLPELGRLSGQRAQPLRFGTLGTIKPVKGTDLLIDAFQRFEKDVAAELSIAGGTDRLRRGRGIGTKGRAISPRPENEVSWTPRGSVDVLKLPRRVCSSLAFRRDVEPYWRPWPSACHALRRTSVRIENYSSAPRWLASSASPRLTRFTRRCWSWSRRAQLVLNLEKPHDWWSRKTIRLDAWSTPMRRCMPRSRPLSAAIRSAVWCHELN